MVNTYLSSGDIAPMILFYNGPASNPFTAARHSFYGWGYTPTFQTDGLLQRIGWNQSIVQGHINSRLAVPSYLDIDVTFVGDEYGGTATYTLTAEQDLGVSSLRLYSAIVESGDIATSAYGVYAGQTLAWEPRAWPCGTTGYAISFTGPYPQTLIINRTYTLDPAQHTFENLDVVTFVQTSAGNKEVMNGSFLHLDGTGVGDSPDLGLSDLVLTIGPNPTSGYLSISSVLPAGISGTIRVFDLQGRIVDEFAAGGTSGINPDETGVYFVRLETSTGEVITDRFTVIR
jgi:hypothetical protein